jgi:SAM-dependent methyltransferase
LANSYLSKAQLGETEPKFPLDLYVCEDCFAAHIEAVATGEAIFSDYAYFSSYSTTWLEHAAQYVAMITERLGLNQDHQVLEIASNDGYLLQYFKERGIPCFGVEPAANVAEAAREKGIETHVAFWGAQTAHALAAERRRADLILGNNVLAHTPDPNDLVAGIKDFLKPGGTVTMEFPHLERLVAENQFDTIYHEHFSYFSFSAVETLFERHGLTLFDVEELPTHGGSLRIYAKHANDPRGLTERARALKAHEEAIGMHTMAYYEGFAQKVEAVKTGLLAFFDKAAAAGKTVAGYGAPAKGNTLLNYCGVTPAQLRYTLDRSPHKQGKFLPGTHVPIFGPERVLEDKPDYLLILPWNLREEIMEQMAHIREWGAKFVVPIPAVTVFD